MSRVPFVPTAMPIREQFLAWPAFAWLGLLLGFLLIPLTTGGAAT